MNVPYMSASQMGILAIALVAALHFTFAGTNNVEPELAVRSVVKITNPLINNFSN